MQRRDNMKIPHEQLVQHLELITNLAPNKVRIHISYVVSIFQRIWTKIRLLRQPLISKNIHFSKESKLELLGSMNISKLFKDSLKCKKKKTLRSVMVWWCSLQQRMCLLFSCMANVYQKHIHEYVVPSLHSSPNQPSIFIQQFTEADKLKTIKWPAHSPVLNLVENLNKFHSDKIIAKK